MDIIMRKSIPTNSESCARIWTFYAFVCTMSSNLKFWIRTARHNTFLILYIFVRVTLFFTFVSVWGCVSEIVILGGGGGTNLKIYKIAILWFILLIVQTIYNTLLTKTTVTGPDIQIGVDWGQILKIEQFWKLVTRYDFLHIHTRLMISSNFCSNWLQLDLISTLVNCSCGANSDQIWFPRG